MDDVLREVQKIAVEQSRVAAALEGHVALDQERFGSIAETLGRIDRRTEQTSRDVAGLMSARQFDRGKAWAWAKIIAIATVLVGVAEVVLAWVRK